MYFKLSLVSFVFIASYFSLFELVHGILDLYRYPMGKYIESLLMCIVPIVLAFFLGIFLEGKQVSINKVWFIGILPFIAIERIGIPIYEYVTAGENWQANLGLSENTSFFMELMLGNIASSYYYNWVYLILTAITIIFIGVMVNYIKIKQGHKKYYLLWSIILNLAILPSIFSLFFSIGNGFINYFVFCIIVGFVLHLIIRRFWS